MSECCEISLHDIHIMAKNLIFILGDQLSSKISSLKGFDKSKDIITMMEVQEEATYVPHHCHKIALIFSAMRHFAVELEAKGFTVEYIKLSDKNNKQSFTQNLISLVKKHKPENIRITEPGEYRVLEMIKQWRSLTNVNTEILNDDRFFCDLPTFKKWADGKKAWRMEHFYRRIRSQTGILMQNNKPVGGKFNYDSENRLPPKENMTFAKRPTVKPDEITKDVFQLIKKHFKNNIGDLSNFNLAVTRKQALLMLNYFIEQHLPNFGNYQDAMLQDEYYLHHSMLSMYLNIGLLYPKEVVAKAETAYLEGRIKINSAEGFIRQILGWREYIRGMYWLWMPKYKALNFFNAKENLPPMYWTGKTQMACMHHCLKQTLETASSHHIQRLMITGNFAMLLGVSPEAICDWYLAVYADAFEWVELPNTLGMSQFADGGIIASKPYAAGGNYINKMSNFCKNCVYDVKQKLTPNACPFNDLYWAFLIANEKKLQANPRLKFAYIQISKMSSQVKNNYLEKRKVLTKKFGQDTD